MNRRGRPIVAVVGFLVLAAVSIAAVKALGVESWWWAAGIVAAVSTVGGAGHFASRWNRRNTQPEERQRPVEKATLLREGRARVRDIDDPVLLGVHPAGLPPGVEAADDPRLNSRVPAYVRRDHHDEVSNSLTPGRFVLVAGMTATGKTRLAYEAVSAQLPDHHLFAPDELAELPVIAEQAVATRKCVLWLDDLDRFLGHGGLTTTVLDKILSGHGPDDHRVLVATIRREQLSPLWADSDRWDDRRRVLQRAHIVQLGDILTTTERALAETLRWDPRVDKALRRSSTHFIENLVGGAELLGRLRDGGVTHPRGTALVTAAIECRRAGWIGPVPAALIERIHTDYLSSRHTAETLDKAWKWATTPSTRTTTALLTASGNGFWVDKDIVDRSIQAPSPGDHAADTVVRAALLHAEVGNAEAIGHTMREQGRHDLAHAAFEHAYRLHAATLGPDHSKTLISRGYLADTLKNIGEVERARAEFETVLQARTTLFGAEHPDTLAIRHSLAVLLSESGEVERARAEFGTVLRARTTLFGAEHPDTLTARHSFARALTALGELEHARAEFETLLEIRTRVSGAEHPDTLTTRDDFASVLSRLGEMPRARAELETLLEVRTRVSGAEHSDTLIARHSLASVLSRLGEVQSARAELQSLLETRTRLLGTENPVTLATRYHLAILMGDLGYPEHARAELETLLDTHTRLLGAEHKHTIMVRHDFVRVLTDLGEVQRARAEFEAVPEARRRL